MDNCKWITIFDMKYEMNELLSRQTQHRLCDWCMVQNEEIQFHKNKSERVLRRFAKDQRECFLSTNFENKNNSKSKIKTN